MSQFTDPLRIEQDPNDRRFWFSSIVLRFHVGHEDSDEIITIPAGSRSDLQSIPPLVWPIFGHPLDEYAVTGFFHDELYKHPDNGVDAPRTRKRCDAIYLEMNIVLGCPWWKRTGKYLGIRLGGWWGWNRYRKADRNREEGV